MIIGEERGRDSGRRRKVEVKVALSLDH